MSAQRIKTLRELREHDTFLCHNRTLADTHNLPCPFPVSNVVWRRCGVVTVEFDSGIPAYRHPIYKWSERASVSELSPMEGGAK